MPFVSYSCLIAPARASSSVLNGDGEKEHTYFVSDLTEKVFSLSSLSMVSCGLFIYDLYFVERVFFIPSLLSIKKNKQNKTVESCQT